MKKYYKIVRHEGDGKFFSAVMEKIDNGKLCREYKFNKWTTPLKTALKKGYGLTCFSSLKLARCFFGSPSVYIFECEIGEIMPLPRFCSFSFVDHRNIGKEPIFDYACWPTGTVMTDKIKLIKRIK